MKERKYTHTCRFCNKDYLGADVKGNCCYDCKSKIPCLVCGKPVSKFTMFRKLSPGLCSPCRITSVHKGKKYTEITGNSNYVSPNKGKKYLDIYGTETPNCGFKNGENNIAKRSDIRLKISSGVKNSYTPELRKIRSIHGIERMLSGVKFGDLKWPNNRGELFRSKLEVDISELLYSNNLIYTYEGSINTIVLEENKVKIVDFIVDDVIIEISGFAYKKWQDDFISKIKKLYNVVTKKILILTYCEHVELISNMLTDYTIKILDINDKENIINYIKGNPNVCNKKKI